MEDMVTLSGFSLNVTMITYIVKVWKVLDKVKPNTLKCVVGLYAVRGGVSCPVCAAWYSSEAAPWSKYHYFGDIISDI